MAQWDSGCVSDAPTADELRAWATALTEVTEKLHFRFKVPIWQVRGKTFLGLGHDETTAVFCVSERSANAAAAHDPEHARVVRRMDARRSFLGLEVSLAHVSAQRVRELVCEAWATQAPRALMSKDVPDDSPVEVPEDIEERVRTLCLALPEVTVRVDQSRTNARSTAQSFVVRGRSFCLLVATAGRAGEPVPRLVLRADPDEREALLAIGHPYFAPRAGPGRIAVLLTKDTDWEEIRELVTESYRVLAPKKLIERLV
jgi:hypothetical protein